MSNLWNRAVEAVNATLPTGGFMIASDLDPVNLLPALSRDKLLDLRQAAKDGHAILIAVTDERGEVQTARQEVDGHIRRLRDAAGYGGFQLAADDPRVVAEQAKADRLATELARLNEIYEARSARWQDMKRLVTALDKSIRNLGPVQAYTGPAPKLGRGETASDAVERCRRRLRELRADLARVEAAPIPSAQAKAKARTEIEALAIRGAPDVFSLVEHGDAIQWPRARAEVTIFPAPGQDPVPPTVHAPDALAVMAWLNQAALIAAIEREIDAAADDANALTDEAKAAKRAEIMADMLATERDEESYIMKAAESGTEIMRRSDASPIAVLGLSDGSGTPR